MPVPTSMDDSFPSDGTFDSMFTLFIVIFVVAAIGAAVVTVMNWKKASDAGVNPFTMETEAMTTLIKSQALAPEKTLEQRLADLDALHAKGTISAAELATARAEVLKSL
ncbi:hypothetical protein [Aeromicrobium sp. UC242_57]|uniref:hypothetical protein n=1 Tax=Aeromicrobium sp. UC242_57 TaxID=3374624 RepID=UPI003799275B